MKNWEYRLVTVRGYFKEQRVFVRKAKDGKEGYAVLAPFVTGVQDVHSHPNYKLECNKNGEHSIMVSLGWVPLDQKNAVEASDEPLPLLEFRPSDLPQEVVTDPDTGFQYKVQYAEDEVKPKYTDLTAIVRKGERWNPLVGNRNNIKGHNYQFIDLSWFSRLFLFNNVQASQAAYLERVVPAIEDTGTRCC
jgi:hypothetical protein